MQRQKTFTQSTLIIPFTIAVIALLAIGCSSNNNTLQRPTSEVNSKDQGKVAGTETTELWKKNISVGTTVIQVEVADNDATRTQGLSSRKQLLEGNGMLFDFTNTNMRKPGFWMKDMLFNIDMIWINNGNIIGITPNVPAPSGNQNLETYYPPSDITHVLEVPALWSQRADVKVGDVVKL